MLKRDLEAGGGGEDQPPSGAWEGQGLRGRETPQGGEGSRRGGIQAWGEAGTLQVWMVEKPKGLVRDTGA